MNGEANHGSNNSHRMSRLRLRQTGLEHKFHKIPKKCRSVNHEDGHNRNVEKHALLHLIEERKGKLEAICCPALRIDCRRHSQKRRGRKAKAEMKKLQGEPEKRGSMYQRCAKNWYYLVTLTLGILILMIMGMGTKGGYLKADLVEVDGPQAVCLRTRGAGPTTLWGTDTDAEDARDLDSQICCTRKPGRSCQKAFVKDIGTNNREYWKRYKSH